MSRRSLNCTEQLLQEIQAGHGVSLAKFTRSLGKNSSTGFRWAFRGVRGIRIEAAFVGHTAYTSPEAGARFLKALSTGEAQDAETIPPRSPGERDRAAARAGEELAAAGW
jgi:hypothetical protein